MGSGSREGADGVFHEMMYEEVRLLLMAVAGFCGSAFFKFNFDRHLSPRTVWCDSGRGRDFGTSRGKMCLISPLREGVCGVIRLFF